MWEAIYSQIEQWAGGLMDELMKTKPAHMRDLDEDRATDLQGEDLLTLSYQEESIFTDSVTGEVEPSATVMPESVQASEFSEDEIVDIAQTTDMSILDDGGFEQAEVMTAEEAVDSVEELMPSKGMLKEVAKSESKLGADSNTYREGYHGGIMQVDEIGYESTKDVKSHPKLKEKFKQIKERYGIDWEDTKWENLRNPLHSAIAARLFLSNIKTEIPDTKAGRAEYWKTHYNTSEGKGTTKHYLDSNPDK